MTLPERVWNELKDLIQKHHRWYMLFWNTAAVVFIILGAVQLHYTHQLTPAYNVTKDLFSRLPEGPLNLTLTPLAALTTTTLLFEKEVQVYHCPECPACVQQACETYHSSVSSTGTTTTSTNYLMELITFINSTGKTAYDVGPSRVDFKYTKCDPFENVTYSVENIIDLSGIVTVNLTLLNGTVVVVNRTEVKTNTIRGGCLALQTGACRCTDGGNIAAMNVKYYADYQSTIKNEDDRIMCPMIMRSPIGCDPLVKCLNGICTVVGR